MIFNYFNKDVNTFTIIIYAILNLRLNIASIKIEKINIIKSYLIIIIYG